MNKTEKKDIDIIKTFCNVSEYLSAAEETTIDKIIRESDNNLRLDADKTSEFDWNVFIADFMQLADFLHINSCECLVFVALYSHQIRRNSAVDWNNICNYLNIDAVKYLELRKNLKSLVKKGIIYYYSDYSDCGFLVDSRIEAGMEQNKFPKREKIIMDHYRFCDIISSMVEDYDWRRHPNNFSKVENAEEKYKTLPFVKQLKTLNLTTEDRTLFYQMCDDFINKQNRQTDLKACLNNTLTSRSDALNAARAFLHKQHPLQTNGLVELTGNGFVENSDVKLTDKAQHMFLGEDYELFTSMENSAKDLLQPEDIMEKRLFFNNSTHTQLNMLKNSLMEENLTVLQERLKNNGLMRGVTVLMLGEPGTGKTESVMQLAKATGRSVYHVDISNCKSKWFGESEKIIKEIFNKYRVLCQRESLKPILLFNEADAIFSKRQEITSSHLTQTENAIQNILLEEMEKLDGILIATTNLSKNFDSAFARRFLFKVQFEQPTTEAKRSIWLDKLPWLGEEQATELAKSHNLSGGEIDNVVRKALMEEVLTGEKPTIETLSQWCHEERFETGRSMPIGFVA